MKHNELPLLPLVLDNVPQGLRRALAQEGVPTCDRGESDATGRFVLFDSRCGSPCSTSEGQTPIDIDPLRGNGSVDPMEALCDERADRFQWELGSWTVSEEIARHDKRTIRRRLTESLRELVESVGGVWVRLGAFPYPYQSALNFRIDYDEYQADDFAAVMRAINGYEDTTSHFVNASAYERAPEALAAMRALDVGSHGYWHHTYRTAEENRRNIARGIDVLCDAGLTPSGFTAPHGRYNRGLQESLNALSIGHSSEFGLAYDDLPFVVHGGRSVQLPVHPVCLGIFLDAARDTKGLSEDQAAEFLCEHFLAYAEARHAMGEPVFLYGHPTGRLGRYPQVVRRSLEAISRMDRMWRTTMTQMADWWRARNRVRMTVRSEGVGYVCVLKNRPSAYPLGIEVLRHGQIARLPLDHDAVRWDVESLSYEPLVERSLPRATRVGNPDGLKHHVRRLIDWERVTPIEEIGRGSWRNEIKRTLRKIA